MWLDYTAMVVMASSMIAVSVLAAFAAAALTAQGRSTSRQAKTTALRGDAPTNAS
jgi:hypothetical protein